MKRIRTLLYSLAVCGLAALTAAPAAFAEQAATGQSPNASNATIKSAASNVYTGNRPTLPQRNDAEIKSDVLQAVDPHKNVAISVEDSVVTLSGEVTSDADRKDVISAARDVSGVRTVLDQMQVTGSGTHSVREYIDDTAITAEVKAKFITESGLSNFTISVDTIDGVVTLTGNVKTKELAAKAAAVASQVKGVKRVDNKLLVMP